MSLESYFEKEKIDVKKLALEEPEKKSELPFDPEKKITPDDWQNLKIYLEKFRNESRWAFFGSLAMEMKILFPERTEELKIDDEAWREMKKSLVRRTQTDDVAGATREIAALKVLFPERAPSMLKSLGPDKFWVPQKRRLKEYREHRLWDKFLAHAEKMKIIFPERTTKLNIDDATWGNLKESLRTEATDRFAKKAAFMRVLSPDRFADLKIDKPLFEKSGVMLEEYRRKNDWLSFLDQAAALKILSAEKVEVTYKGLEITMPKKEQEFKEITPPLLEIKKF